MAMEEGTMTPQNSSHDVAESVADGNLRIFISQTSPYHNLDAAIEDKECCESLLSQIVKNVLSSAANGDTIITAKPRKIIQPPN